MLQEFLAHILKTIRQNCFSNIRKQVTVQELPLEGVKVFQELILKLCNDSFNFSILETSYRYSKSCFRQS